MIVDNFSLNNLISIESYSTGEEFVKNKIVYKTTKTANAFIDFVYNPKPGDQYYITVFYKGEKVQLGVVTTVAAVLSTFNSSALFIDNNISMSIINPYDPSKIAFTYPEIYDNNLYYSFTSAFRITLANAEEFDTLSVETIQWSDPVYTATYASDETGFDYIFCNSPLREIYYFTPYFETNAFITYSDADSIAKYGAKYFILKDDEKTLYDLQGVMNTKLQDLKSPKARMVIHTLNNNDVDLLNEVEVRLSMQNIDKFWSFTEGGIFKSWEKTDKYRYKLFSIFGIRVLDNNVTSLTLVEKLQDISETIEEEDMPIGSVVAYAGSTGAIPTNWLLCDGASYSQTTYSSLFAVIGTYHGTTGTGLFNVPDYTGRFLRGVDINSVRDPDRASRTAMNTGGNTGNLVGSIQEDAFESHAHTVPYSNGSGGGTPYAANGNAVFSSYASGSAGGNETRPVNAYVHYIIRAN